MTHRFLRSDANCTIAEHLVETGVPYACMQILLDGSWECMSGETEKKHPPVTPACGVMVCKVCGCPRAPARAHGSLRIYLALPRQGVDDSVDIIP